MIESTASTPAAVSGGGQAVRAERRRRKRGRAPSEPRAVVAYLWVLPAFLVFCLFSLGPLIHTVWLSFFEWNGITPGRWIGLGNYRAMVSDPQLRASLLHPLVMILCYCVIPIVVALPVTAVMTRIKIRGLTFYRAVIFLPQVLATVAIALAWRNILALQGPIDGFLRLVGLGSFAQAWLGSFTWALWALGLIGSWYTFGFCVVLFIAGAQKIPRELYDAARVDGASPVREFFAVTLPGLRGEIIFAVILTMIYGLSTFDINYVLTKGGPGLSTSVPAYEVYRQAFYLGEVGRAAAFGVALTLIVMVIVMPLARLGSKVDS